MRRLFFCICPLFFMASFSLRSQQVADTSVNVEALLQLSLEELMEVRVTSASLVGFRKQLSPASVTTITHEMIRITPARNILDLIETYVPGAVWINHYEGGHPGIRGLIVDRNYKFLLLVNGVNLNQKSHNGASTELENWELSDIERIEIVRGPGSVTYGPGAIMGVVNLITKDGNSFSGTEIHASAMSRYNSFRAAISHGENLGKMKMYGHASITSTKGFTPRAFAVREVDSLDYEAGYLGHGLGNVPPQTYFRDYNDLPQVKTHLSFSLPKEWDIWARFTNCGTTLQGNLPRSRPILGHSLDSISSSKPGQLYHSPFYGHYMDIAQLSHKQFTLAFEKKAKLGNLDWVNRASWYTEDFERRDIEFFEYSKEEHAEMGPYLINRPYHPRLFLQNYSEEEFSLYSLARYPFGKKHVLALGAQYSLNHVGPGWGDSPREMVIGDDGSILNDSTSFLLGYPKFGGIEKDKARFAGNGWYAGIISFFGEGRFLLHDKLDLLLSGRADKHEFSRWVFSPRVALVSEINQNHSLRLIGQYSNRLNTYSQLYLYRQSQPEILRGLELIYDHFNHENMLLSATLYYNDVDILSWSNKDISTKHTGHLRLFGSELEGQVMFSGFRLGANHSFTRMISWKLDKSLSSSGISPADLDIEHVFGPDTIHISGHGNQLANWPDQSTKLWANINIYQDKLSLFTDFLLFWGYPWGEDALQAKLEAVKGTVMEKEFDDIARVMRDENVYSANIRWDISLRYSLSDKMKLQASVYNILGGSSFYRYSMWSFWQPFPIPEFVKEPRAFQVSMEVSF